MNYYLVRKDQLTIMKVEPSQDKAFREEYADSILAKGESMIAILLQLKEIDL